MVVIDGIRYTSPESLFLLDNLINSEQVKGLVFLRPAEAGVLFGNDSRNGVLLVITKTGSR